MDPRNDKNLLKGKTSFGNIFGFFAKIFFPKRFAVPLFWQPWGFFYSSEKSAFISYAFASDVGVVVVVAVVGAANVAAIELCSVIFLSFSLDQKITILVTTSTTTAATTTTTSTTGTGTTATTATTATTKSSDFFFTGLAFSISVYDGFAPINVFQLSPPFYFISFSRPLMAEHFVSGEKGSWLGGGAELNWEGD